jgi:hypothetical protein
MRLLHLVLVGLASFSLVANGFADTMPPAEAKIDAVIDQLVDAKLRDENVKPATQADDYTLIRRLTLDLVGRIPTVSETDEYVKSNDSEKRAKLIERLLNSPAFDRYQAVQFDAMLNAIDNGNRRSSVRDYLTAAMKERKSWDRIFRELMLPDGTGATKGAAEFLRSRVQDADKMTNDVSVAFFGVNVSCAQCHDHPLVKDWTQDHFYGMKTFLSRTYDMNGVLAEREAGVVKFLPNKGKEKAAKMMFLTGTVIETDTLRELTKEEQKKEKELKDKKSNDAKEPLPRPTFSAREKLVEVALKAKEAEFFSRSLANRLWHRFLGTGLVNPLDQMHSENPASHPELLTWLARDIASHGYDIRRTIRGIVMSQTYSRDSRYETDRSRPEDKLFAVAKLKPLTPQQVGTSLKIATSDPKMFENLKPEEFEKRIEQAEQVGRGIGSLIAQPTDNFQIGVGEALLFSNGDRITKEFLTDNGLLGTLKGKDSTETVKQLVRTAMARPATDDEVKTLTSYLKERSDRTNEANRQVLWALVTCPEFRFCH